MKILDDKLLRHDEILGDLTTTCKELNEPQTGIRGTLELILDHLTALKRAPPRVPEGVPPGRDGLLPNPMLNSMNRLPIPPSKWELPSFEGAEPKVWLRKCETYFNLY